MKHESSGSTAACIGLSGGRRREQSRAAIAAGRTAVVSTSCAQLASTDLGQLTPCAQVSFVPGCAEWIYDRQEAQAKLALSDLNSGAIHVYDMKSGSSEAVQVVQVHKAPVTAMRYAAAHRVVVSSDSRGFLEYWSSSSGGHPEELVTYK